MKDQFIAQLAAAPGLLDNLIRSIPDDRIDRNFGPGIWSVHQHLDHLTETQAMLLGRLRLILADPRPVIVPFVPDAEGSGLVKALAPVEDLLRDFRSRRVAQLEVIRSARATDWDKPATHPEYTRYSFGFLVRHILYHDGAHFYRIEDLGFLQPELILPM